ncbi:MAG: hypothetical protein RBG13Loki_4273 [Promethearchaeota archaeon CR_4]|nr:MAG: hypothetical protein RBG13Loki_4273 [Candidatus Lokiarchaeota archaeon CR_4]
MRDALDTLAKRVSQSITAKREMIVKMRDIEALIKVIVTDPNARITQDQVQEYGQLIADYVDRLDNNQSLVDGLKDIVMAYRSFLTKKEGYYEAYSNFVDLESGFHDDVYKYRKMTNRMETGEKVNTLEMKIREKDNEIERVVRDRIRQLASLVDEGKEVDQAWLKLKNYLREFTF